MRITSLADYQKTYELSVQEPEKFWAGIANEFEWSKPFTKVLDWNFDDYSVKWFEDGQLNITTNFLTNEEVLDFCYNNDLMAFAYRHGRDISGVPDYVISTNTPLAVTNVGMFNPVYSSDIDMALHTLPEIIEFNKIE
jgi:hypothetical protein